MVFQKRVMTAVNEKKPQSLDELSAIPGLGPVKIDRFGQDIIHIVEKHIDM